MRTLIDGLKVSSGLFCFLLEFNNKTEHKFMEYHFKKSKLCDLTFDEFQELCYYAIQLYKDGL